MTLSHTPEPESPDPAIWSWSPPTDLAALRDSLGPIYVNDGADYHTGEQFQTAANRVLGPHNWSTEILEGVFDDQSGEYSCRVKLTVTIWLVDPNDPGRFITRTVTKEDWGSHKLRISRSTNQPQSIGDSRKAAVTDGTKRCLHQLGFGAYLWEKDDASIREGTYKHSLVDDGASSGSTTTTRPAAVASAPRSISDAPLPAPARAALLEHYTKRLAEARQRGMAEQDWMATEPQQLSDVQLKRYSALCVAHLERARKEGVA